MSIVRLPQPSRRASGVACKLLSVAYRKTALARWATSATFTHRTPNSRRCRRGQSRRNFYLRTAFRRIGITSYTFLSNGQDTIDYLKGIGRYTDRQKFPFPRWLLLEMKLPRVSGFDVLAWLYEHQHCRIIPTVAFSDSDLDADVRRSYELGANAYFVKPRGFQPMIDCLALIDHFWKIAMAPVVHPENRCT